MKKYLSFFKMRFTTILQYRAAAAAGVVTQFAWGGLELLAYRAFYQSNPAAFPMGFQALASYIWLRQSFLVLFTTWFFENEIFDTILQGGIAYEMVRPVGLYAMWYTRSMANRLSKAALRCMPILVVAALVKSPYGVGLPDSISAGIWFLITSALGLFVTVSLGMLIYISAFYTTSTRGVRGIMVAVGDFLAGSLIPLPFLPEGVRKVIELLPFASTLNVPLRVYSGDIAGAQLVQCVILQIFWIVVLTAAGSLWMKKALHRVVVQGG